MSFCGNNTPNYLVGCLIQKRYWYKPEIPIDDDDSDQNGNCVHDECEEQVFGNEREDERGRWQNFGYEQEEHNEWQENADTKCDFFSGLCR